MQAERFTEILDAEFSEPFVGLATAIEQRKDRIAEKFHDALSQQALVDVIKSGNYFGDSNDHSDYQVRMVLMRALRLAADPVANLVLLALDDDQPWYVRTGALNVLSERANRADLVKVLPLVSDSQLEGEIRHAAIRALSQNGITELLEVIGREDFNREWHDADLHLTIARARLGDRSSFLDLLTLAVDDWGHRRNAVKDVLPDLVAEMGGAEAVARQLLADQGATDTNDALLTLLTESTDERIKMWAVGQRTWDNQAGLDALLGRLDDDSWRVRYAASQELRRLETSEAILVNVLVSASAKRRQKLWALRTLLRMDLRPDAELIEAIGEIYVPWEFDAGALARQVVVARFAAHGQPGSDVRYEIEMCLQEQTDGFDTEATKVHLREALVSQGLACSEWQEIGDYNGSGSGECWVLEAASHVISLNKSGPLAAVQGSPDNHSAHEMIHQTLATCEITVLTDEQLDNIVPNLNVYYFGRREPLSVRQLLFYWQD